MAFRLTKDELATRGELVEKLNEQYATLSSAVDDFNATLEGAWGTVEAALADYNEALAEAETFRDELVGRLTEEADDKSDKWQEGERGSAARDWIGEWESLDLSEASLDAPDTVDLNVTEHGGELEAIADEAET